MPKSQPQPIKTPAEWARRREQILACVQQVMGPLPGSARRVPLDVRVLEEHSEPDYVRRKITYVPEPGDRVGWLLLPKVGRRPAMLCLHQTTNIGKDEPAGLGGLQNLHYAQELAARRLRLPGAGLSVVRRIPYDFKTKDAHYVSGSMKAVWKNIRGVDCLSRLAEVDPSEDRRDSAIRSAATTRSSRRRLRHPPAKRSSPVAGSPPFPDYYGGQAAGWTSHRYMPRIRDVIRTIQTECRLIFTSWWGQSHRERFLPTRLWKTARFDVTGVAEGDEEFASA